MEKKIQKYYRELCSDAYFRDPYNPNSALWWLGLSWWRDVVPMLNKRSELNIQSVKRLREMVRSAMSTDLGTEYPKEVGIFLDEATPDKIEKWRECAREGQKELIKFLDKTISLRSAIISSL